MGEKYSIDGFCSSVDEGAGEPGAMVIVRRWWTGYSSQAGAAAEAEMVVSRHQRRLDLEEVGWVWILRWAVAAAMRSSAQLIAVVLSRAWSVELREREKRQCFVFDEKDKEEEK